MAGIYVHIPFCKQACHYCNFHFSTNLKLQDDMVDAICKEAELRSEYLKGYEIETIYFGGGTPSILNESQLSQIVGKIRERFTIGENYEFTLEANPDDITEARLQLWLKNGVNRLSLGVQSFDDEILATMNRVHHGADSVIAIKKIREAGISNLNVDLIYGVKKDNHVRWKHDLDLIQELLPEHISSYGLTIEEKTVFGNWVQKGKWTPPDDEYIAEEFEMATVRLKSLGYDHYEVSNYGLPNFISRHNSGYWQDRPYLGLGPGAHSFNLVERQFNISNNPKYIDSVRRGLLPSTAERLSIEDRINEYILTRLRTKWGLSIPKLEEMGYDLDTQKMDYVESIKELGYCTITGDEIVLTERGFLLADEISTKLFVEKVNPGVI